MRIVALLVLVGCEGKTLGFGSPLPSSTPRFSTACASDVDCVLVPAEAPCACGCGERAISARADDDFWAWYLDEQAACPPIVCTDCPTDLPVSPTCADGACTTRIGAEEPAVGQTGP